MKILRCTDKEEMPQSKLNLQLVSELHACYTHLLTLIL